MNTNDHYHFIMYKPYGYLSQFVNNQTKRKNKKLLGELYDFPEGTMAIGRLDEDSEGLLLLTTDGKTSEFIRSKKIEKEYFVQLDGIIHEDAIDQLRQGLYITVHAKKYKTKACTVLRLEPAPIFPERTKKIRDERHGATSWISITLTEGKFRQVRKMTAAVGFPTLRLVRVRIGEMELNSMKTGEVKEKDHLIDKPEKKNELMKKRLLIIGFVWPEPDSTAAGSRMLQLIDFFQKNDYEITFVSTAAKSDKSYPLEQRSIVTSEIQLNNASFDKLLNQIKPMIVLFDRFLTEEQFGWRVSENCPDAIRILDTEDLHFLRHARHLAIKNKDKLSLKHLVNNLFKRELASIYRCDLTLIISKFELELLTKTFKVDHSILIYLPFLLPNLDQNMINSYPTFNERSNFISIGNFKHEPNWNAVLYLKNIIWPMIKNELPEAELHIYGAYATEKVNQLHSKKDGFLIRGWAKKAEDVFINAKVCLAPLKFGAGLKGKLIDSMLYGTPSVTTKIGAEAMHDKLPWNGFITDDPEEFTRRAVELYQNENLWLDAQNKGVQIINQCYDKEKFVELFTERIIHLIEDLKYHRMLNTIGILLQHHTLKSTKYLSKWIEEKNKNI